MLYPTRIILSTNMLIGNRYIIVFLFVRACMFSFDETKTSAPFYLRRPFMINGLTLDAKSCMKN
jgi:hypothetical protein